MNKLLVLAIPLVATAIVGACGGNVVVDPGSAGTGIKGMGGAPGGSNSTGLGGTGVVGLGGSMGLGGENASCLGNIAGAMQCSGSTTTGAGQPTTCQFFYCGGINNWTATCQGNACQCLQQTGDGGGSSTSCACELPGGTDACGSNTQCCFTL